MAIFQVNLGEPVSPLIFSLQWSLIPILSILIGQAKTLHIPFNTIPPSLPQTSPLSSSLKLHLHTLLEPVCIISTFTCPNHCNQLLLNDKLTGSSRNNSLTSVFFFLSFKLKPHIYLSILISFHLQNNTVCNLDVVLSSQFYVIFKL